MKAVAKGKHDQLLLAIGIFLLAIGLCVRLAIGAAPASAPATTSTTSASSGALPDHLLFYASFDRSRDADYWSGSTICEGKYAPAQGILSSACHTSGSPLRYQAMANFDHSVGTLAFWVRLDASALKKEQGDAAALFNVPNANFCLGVLSSNQLNFMTGSAPPGKDFAWDYSTHVELPSPIGQNWLHVALTWDAASGRKTIYLNGRPMVTKQRDFKSDNPPNGQILFGAAQGDYDELAIWNRVLSDDEIKLLVTDPALLPAAARSLPPNIDANPWQLYPELVMMPYDQCIISPGENFSINLPLRNRTKEAVSAKVTLQAQGMDDADADKPQTFDIKVGHGERTSIKATFSPARLGIYRVAVTVQVNSHSRSRDVCSFAVLPAGSPPADRFFGTHVGGEPGIAQAVRRIGFCSNRVHDMTQFTWWTRMEPQRGQWSPPGKEYARYEALGFTHFGEWFAAPNWAVTDASGKSPPPNSGYPKAWVPTDQEALRDYVRQSLKEFPDIKEWEIWNEPYVPMFWRGSAKDYVELCKTIYTTAKAARPDIVIFSQVNYEGEWSRQAFEAGLMNYCDGVAYHWYAPPSTPPQTAAEMPAQLREWIAKYSSKSPQTVPIIETEGCVTCGTFLRGLDDPLLPPEPKRPPSDAAQAAATYIATRIVMMANNVNEDYFYCACPYSQQGARFCLFDVTNGPKPLAAAANQLMWQLDDGKYAGPVDGLPAGLRGYLFRRDDGKTLAVLWSENGGSFTLPAGLQAFGLMGNPLDVHQPLSVGLSPVYLPSDATVADFARELSALKMEPSSQPRH